MTRIRRFGPVVLAEGYRPLNAAGVMLAGFTVIPLLGFIGLIQPYLLEEVFEITHDLGRLTGQLASLQELVVILLMGFVGAASDNLGRRVIMVTGLCIVALGLCIYPLAQDELQIYGFRAVFAVGAAIAPVMYGVSLQDAPANRSRGVFLGLGSVCTGLGMMIMSLSIGKLPKYLVSQGISPFDAGIYTCWCMVGFALLVALLIRQTWRAGRVAELEPRSPVLDNLIKGFAEARKNPRIALAYLTAFASRGDLVAIGIFMPLWVQNDGADAGLSSGQGLARAGIMFAVTQGAAMLWSPVVGFIADRVNRVLCVCIGFSIASAAYFGMSMVEDPFLSTALIACVAVGIGEIFAIVSGGPLLGQEAPKERRGAVVGVFGMTGAFSILCCSFAGGIIFDEIGRTAPFALMGCVNLVVVLTALLVLWRAPGMSAQEVRRST